MIKLQIDLEPKPKQRPKVGRGRAYTPAQTARYEAAISEAAAHLIPMEGALELEAVFVFPRLKATPKSEPERALKATRPDLDNLIKALKDGLQGHAFNDDAQITQLKARKVYAALGERPHIEVSVMSIDINSTGHAAHTGDAHTREELEAPQPLKDRATSLLRQAKRQINRELHRRAQEERDKKLRRLRADEKEKLRALKLKKAHADYKLKIEEEIAARKEAAEARWSWPKLSKPDKGVS
jgi:Holliday junction resolvase RusA-like endonuclease